MIHLFLVGLALMVVGGACALAMGRRSGAAALMGAGSLVGGALLGLIPTASVLVSGTSCELRLPWNLPYASFFLRIDPLSAWFLMPTLCLSALAAIYGVGYMAHSAITRRIGVSWFFYNLLVAGMLVVITARNGVLFFFAWEVMTLASWFLVTLEDSKRSVREAGWVYLVASHVGAAFLLVFFAILANGASSLDFDSLEAGGKALQSSTAAVPLFVLALLGFGTKAGFFPLHVWLPEAHPAAPSHVSAVMSGVMIKTGLYGILRSMMLLGSPQTWWGYALVAIGIVSGIGGVLFALAQHDLKRLLAYSSVENVGIMTMSIGLGVVAAGTGHPTVAVLGIAGGLLHMWNHAIFKGMLFLTAGSVLHGTGTLQIDKLGGLLRRMPWTGVCALAGAVAISGLPPLNGFMSELAVYLASLEAASLPASALAILAVAVIASLALIGGLAAVCFAKAFGISFLGEPRSEAASGAHESGRSMIGPMLILAVACVGCAAGTPLFSRLLGPLTCGLIHAKSDLVQQELLGLSAIQLKVVVGTGFLTAVVLALAAWRRSLLLKRTVRKVVTWDCGYVAPTARMQYTSSSFVQPITSMFAALLRTSVKRRPLEGVLPESVSMESNTDDVVRQQGLAPLFRWIDLGLGRLRWLQHGRLHLYILYIAVTLLVLLAWNLGGGAR